MKRILILIVLVVLAGVAGVVVRSASHGGVAELRGLVSHQNVGDVRADIGRKFELSPGARVELSGLNGPVKIETSDTTTAEASMGTTRRVAGHWAARSPSSFSLAKRSASPSGIASPGP